MRFSDTALLDAAGKLPESGKQKETMTSVTICQELDNPTGLFCGISLHIFDLGLWCISEISLLTSTSASIVTSCCSLPFSFLSLIESGFF